MFLKNVILTKDLDFDSILDNRIDDYKKIMTIKNAVAMSMRAIIKSAIKSKDEHIYDFITRKVTFKDFRESVTAKFIDITLTDDPFLKSTMASQITEEVNTWKISNLYSESAKDS